MLYTFLRRRFLIYFELVLSVSLSLPNIFAKQFSILIFRILKKICIRYETQCNDPKTCVHAICVTMLVQYIFITFVTMGSATNWHLLHLDIYNWWWVPYLRLIIDYDRYVLAYTHNLRAASLVSIRNSSKNMNSYL